MSTTKAVTLTAVGTIVVVVTVLLLLWHFQPASYTGAEQAYLIELQATSSQITNEHPDEDVQAGHAICDALAKTKPEERYSMGGILAETRPFNRHQVLAATMYLCPDLKGTPG